MTSLDFYGLMPFALTKEISKNALLKLELCEIFIHWQLMSLYGCIRLRSTAWSRSLRFEMC